MCPDDPATIGYWKGREEAKAAKRWLGYQSRLKMSINQQHTCPICMQSLYNGEELHAHHLEEKALGGKDTYANLALLHEICHRQAHSIKIPPAEIKKTLRALRPPVARGKTKPKN